MLRLHVASTSNEMTLVVDHMKTTTDIQLSLTNYEELVHLMLLPLHMSSSSNEITLVGNHMKFDLIPTDIMP